MLKSFINYLKKEIVFSISFVLALITTILVRPSLQNLNASINYSVLIILFCLMIQISGLRSFKILDKIALFIVKKCSSVFALFVSLVLLVFFSAMIITNDVALLTFVPLTIIICKQLQISPVTLIVLETIGANLGSTLTPMGNPQNLFLYSFYTYTPQDFFSATSGIVILSGIFLVGASYLISKRFSFPQELNLSVCNEKSQKNTSKTILLFCLLLVSLLTVFHILPIYLCLALTVLGIVIIDKKLFTMVDYTLLGTFICFFIFVGNISALEEIVQVLKKILQTPIQSFFVSLGISQIISNVPASLLIAPFTPFRNYILWGVNLGGLGTIIASLASLISYKLYLREGENASSGQFMKTFTLYNLLFLSILTLCILPFLF